MAGKVTIDKVGWPQNDVVGNQTLSVYYKLATQPASSYVTFTTNMIVAPDGIPVASPLPQITGLTSGALYDIMFVQNCGSPSPYWTIQVTPD